MSGGSWDYAYIKLEEISERLKSATCPYRRALGRKLDKFTTAIHDIEWVDSSDMGEGDDIPAIKKALGKNCELEVGKELYMEIERIQGYLDKLKQGVK